MIWFATFLKTFFSQCNVFNLSKFICSDWHLNLLNEQDSELRIHTCIFFSLAFFWKLFIIPCEAASTIK